MSKLSELLAKHKAQLAASKLPPTSQQPEQKEEAQDPNLIRMINQYGKQITLNQNQSEFVKAVLSGLDTVLIGPAGTGKTTCTQAAITQSIQSGKVPTIESTDDHKYLSAGTPGIVCVSFTRRAVRNIKRAMSEDMKHNCITIHKLLEYQPQYYTVFDEATGEDKTTMGFEPTRTSSHPLPSTIKKCFIDESSMVSVQLEQELRNALPADCQFIYIGDIYQLPPVFGSATLGYKLLEAKVVELTEVYRQALESPIIELATSIRKGEPQPFHKENFTKQTSQGKLTIHPWKKKLHAEIALLTSAKFFTQAMETGVYDPSEDMILTPFNKACGTIELNKHIAQYIARKNKREVYEVIAGFNKHYFSVGDLVLCDKEDAEVISVVRNGTYLGKKPLAESLTLDYWGYDPNAKQVVDDLDDVDAFLAAASSDSEEKVNNASHIITVRMLDSDQEVTLDTAAEINSLILSYALTCHKSQGSEWRKVFVLLHQSHNTMLQNELLYTAITRAREELYIICEPDQIQKGTASRKIKGNTLAEKAEYFKGKLETQGKLGLENESEK
jgi:GTPase SAR1 family protein